MTTLLATHTHLYPGARGRAEGVVEDGPATIVFTDEVRVPARLEGETLHVEAYETGAGTGIIAKSWRVTFAEDGRFRAIERLTR